MRVYEIPFRPIYEGWAALAWAAGTFAMFLIVQTSNLPRTPFYFMAAACVSMGLWRTSEALRRWREKRALKEGSLRFIDWKRFRKKANQHEGVWLGTGFTWGQQEVERALEILKRDPERFIGKRALKFGHQWIHGLGSESEKDLYLPQNLLGGHTLIVATTGALKTRLLDLLVSQAIMREEAVIIFDPKGDHELRANARRACELTGHPERFIWFHPAFPEASARIDPLRNWNRPTEIASRIATLIPSETGADPFAAFGWMSLNNIVNGLLAVEEKPNLVKLRRYLEGDPGPLVVKALRAHFEKKVKNWESRIHPYQKKMRDREVEAHIQFYQAEVVGEASSPELEGLITAYTHNREHFQKMIASLLPILNMLTGGTLGELLSPDTSEADARPITDMSRIIQKGQVVYVGLDSLADSTVGSAIGSIMLADLTAVAGDRYNYEVGERPVNVFIDEAAEILNVPTVQMLNKGRGAGFRLTLATQTLADFEVRTGSAAAARQALGNLNNLITGRVLDGETQKYIAENLPKTMVRSLEEQYRSGSSTNDPSEFNGMYGESIKEEEVELFPPSLLGMLPNLHYLAKFANGKMVKGRLPILTTKGPGDKKRDQTKKPNNGVKG